VPRLEALEDRTLPSILTVTNTNDKGPGSLRAEIGAAASGDVIVFASSLDGQTITLTKEISIQKNLDIEGPGAGLLAVSGGGTNRIFDVQKGPTVTIDGLTLTHGLANGNVTTPHGGSGGAIVSVASVLNLANDVFSNNVSETPGPSIRNGPNGGAVSCLWSGALAVNNCTFLNNRADASQGTLWAEGGAIYSDPGAFTVTVSGSDFVGNQAIGGNGGVLDPNTEFGLGDASGGAIHAEGPASFLTVNACNFTANAAIGGSGSSYPNGPQNGGYYLDGADGGAIVCHDSANLTLSKSTFTNNAAIGGSSSSAISALFGWMGAGIGGAIHAQGATTITSTTFRGNVAIGGSGDTAGSGTIEVGGGYGGAIYKDAFVRSASPLNVSNSTFTNNVAVGGAGNQGGILAGEGIGGGIMTIFYGPLAATVTAAVLGCRFDGNQAVGGSGGAAGTGADGLGGALANVLGATLTVSGCTLSGNQASGGAGGTGGNGGAGFGGGLYNDGTSTVIVAGSKVTNNQAAGGAAGTGGSAGTGFGGGLYLAAGGAAYLDAHTLAKLAGNTASTSNNDMFGTFTTY
jgi:hypothetical protein